MGGIILLFFGGGGTAAAAVTVPSSRLCKVKLELRSPKVKFEQRIIEVNTSNKGS